MSCNSKIRMSLRVNAQQYQVLTELKEGLNTTYATLLRAIITDFITHNEDALERIVEKHQVDKKHYNNIKSFDDLEEEYD